MRYHFGILSPSSQMNHQSGSSLNQRSLPTCTISLASATASTASNHIGRDSAAMVVDPPSFSIPSLSMMGQANIPFPTTGKRTHSLLRAAAYSQRSMMCTSANQSDEFSTGLDPPRKRSRTCALRPSKERSSRATSTRFLFHVNHPTSESFPRPTTAKYPLIPPPPTSTAEYPSQTPSGEALPTPSRPNSHLDSPHHLTVNPLPLPCGSISTRLAPKPILHSSTSSRWRSKRQAASEIGILLSLHQALIYGLALRWSIGMSDVIPAAGATDSMKSEHLQSSQDGVDSFYMQDAILERHLRAYLLANGVDAVQAFREIHSVGLDSHNAPRLAYRRMVASLIIRHRCSPSRSRARASMRNNAMSQRRPSGLSASVNLD